MDERMIDKHYHIVHGLICCELSIHMTALIFKIRFLKKVGDKGKEWYIFHIFDR